MIGAIPHILGAAQPYVSSEINVINGVESLIHRSFGASHRSGWWADPKSGLDLLAEVRGNTRFGKALVAEKLVLVHSEISEALEAYRKDAADDKLPHRKGIEVELADSVIRIADLCGALDLDLGAAIVDKMNFNATRADHKPEARAAAGGKAF